MSRSGAFLIVLSLLLVGVAGFIFGAAAERAWFNIPNKPVVYVIHEYLYRWGGLRPYAIVYSVNGHVHRVQFGSEASRYSFRNHLYALGGKE